ncbi:MAG: glycosyltransferase family 2 protein [Leptospirillia bacterium]
MTTQGHIAVVIPCYKVTGQILDVIKGIGPECDKIYVVDDACPDGSGKLVQDKSADPRVTVLFHESNQGVGGATITGIRQAVMDGAAVIVKVDGDGQMDAQLIPVFARLIFEGKADYTKGNRFHDPEGVSSMPTVRLLGNAVLSFLTKLSSGYWDLFDPTNGFVAMHRDVARVLPLDKVSRDYFFESDMLFRLNISRAVVVDIPIRGRYADEVSNLVPSRIALTFAMRHLRNFVKRIAYSYFLRDFNLASLNLMVGFPMFIFGLGFGLTEWAISAHTGIPATAGTVMLSALPTLLGMQLLLSFLAHDMLPENGPPLHQRLHPGTTPDATEEETG